MFLISRGGGQEQFTDQINHQSDNSERYCHNLSTVNQGTNNMSTVIFKFKFVGEHTKYMAHASKRELSKSNLNDVEHLKKLTEPLESPHTHTYHLTIKYTYSLFTIGDYEDVKQYFEQLVAEKKLSFDNKPLSVIVHDVWKAIGEHVDHAYYKSECWPRQFGEGHSLDIMEDDTCGFSISYIK